tara:strand:- start:521 stop:991 length:471 start_codon:yes stop_codon:yes gene_type:complete
MSILKVDTINEKTTGNGVAIPGHVVQVQNTGWNTTFNTTSTSFVTTGHSVTITPKFASSKIFLNLAGGSWYIEAGTAMVTIYRNSTNIGEATGGLAYKQGNQNARYHPHSASAYDSPNTTSAITYTVYIKSENGTTTYYSYPQYGIMSLTAMEIAQ